jgi:hypothetical protein
MKRGRYKERKVVRTGRGSVTTPLYPAPNPHHSSYSTTCDLSIHISHLWYRSLLSVFLYDRRE